MALHGEVKVNGLVVATWEAVRVSGGVEPDDLNRYVWTVVQRTKVRPPRGERAGRTVGYVDHRYGDGAVALASKVLTASGEAVGD